MMYIFFFVCVRVCDAVLCVYYECVCVYLHVCECLCVYLHVGDACAVVYD